MIKIGIIGTGGVAHGHVQRYLRMKGVSVVACCDISEEKREAFARRWNIPAQYEDFREMLRSEKLDGVSNCTPDSSHAKVAIEALRHNVAVLSEKPMAASLAEAERMWEVAKASKVPHMINFSYRRSGALHGAARAIRAGHIGRIRHVEGSYLQSWLVADYWGDWKSPAFIWRLSTRHGSSGVLGDLGCHLYDFVTYLCGNIVEIACALRTFPKGVPGNRIGEFVLDANDSFSATVTFENGALGVLHSSRWASGHHNSIRVRIYGDQGGIEIDLDHSPEIYRIVRGERNLKKALWREVVCPPAPTIQERFIRAIRTGKAGSPDFREGLQNQKYLHYSFLSDQRKRAVQVQ